ncbi:hypothetical protein M3N64_11815 [Sporolactobacillus sp. CPB3-1]|uniref:YpoC-like domain-containing protein n=1 Tax=Sporolactobacillus mangiferae TaxID=2940498 RepID=A0ABT0MCK7_9BACL|nr:hypothetical protein [Sporolactobacillus mangiferae]MCL1632604.1 hypothetical protein [Sporolactobacillus mangiferae]
MNVLPRNLEIPDSFRFAPFFVNQKRIEKCSVSKPHTFQTPFLYDMLYHHNVLLSFPWPWEQEENYFHIYWKKNRDALCSCFHQRKYEQARAPMIRSIAALIDQLFWTNGCPVQSLDEVDLYENISTLSAVPLNCKERLNYLLHQPSRYLSFVQLDELEREFTKKRAAYLQKRKRV